MIVMLFSLPLTFSIVHLFSISLLCNVYISCVTEYDHGNDELFTELPNQVFTLKLNNDHVIVAVDFKPSHLSYLVFN